jgi:excisionase family DNA binding protein
MNGTLLTAAQVAKLLGVPKSWVYEQSRRGRIPTVTLGRYRRYRLEAIDEWIRKREESGADTNGDAPRPLLGAAKGGRGSRALR